MPYTLTTPLYYVNDKPHLGSTYTTIACDGLARYQRLRNGFVVFITGVDEHGQKIQRTAERQGVSPRSTAIGSAPPTASCGPVGESVRTASFAPPIRDTFNWSRQFFARVEASGDVVTGRQTGWYCVDCEEFKDDPADAVDPDCPIHRKPLEWRDEQICSSGCPATRAPLRSW